MARNEIRLRRQMMSSGRIAQHRNYSALMARHDRDVKMKRLVRVFIYFLIIAFIVILFFIIRRWEEKRRNTPVSPSTTAMVLKSEV